MDLEQQLAETEVVAEIEATETFREMMQRYSMEIRRGAAHLRVQEEMLINKSR